MQASTQKSRKSKIPSTRIQSFVRGSLDRIAQRRYTRDLFDDIVNCPINFDSEITVTDEEKLLTLLRCFNNFFNKKFDAERLFKAIHFSLTKENSKVICSWLSQKKADNIYVIGRFILHITSYLEAQRGLNETDVKKAASFLSLVFCDSSKILDENLILIFSFLSRKGYFRSSIGFMLANFDVSSTDIKTGIVSINSSTDVRNPIDIWLFYLKYPLSFAVHWRTKVEDWIKAEAEKIELYGSNGSFDEDYSTNSIMNLSLMSASSEFSNEDPNSRQTRIFLKGLLSSWCNSVYFNDNFYQYYVTPISISVANTVLINTVPIYLIILALVEPIRQRRKYSIGSMLGSSKTLLIQYKLNANSSLGLLSLLANDICQSQLENSFPNIGQEEAYGIIVCLHLCIMGLFENPISKYSERKRCSVFNVDLTEIRNGNDALKSTKSSCESAISSSACPLMRIALSGALDPDVVLPLACLYRNLRRDLNVTEKCVLECRILLCKQVAFIRYLWSLCIQSTMSSEKTSLQSLSQRRTSDTGEKSVIIKILSDGKLIEVEDMYRFLNIISTLLECVTFHLNTLYITEARRKGALPSGTFPSAIGSQFLLWPELWNIASELSSLSMGLIKVAVSLVNLKNANTSVIRCQSDTDTEDQWCHYRNVIHDGINEVLMLIRIFNIQIDKFNLEKVLLPEIKLDSNLEKLLLSLTLDELKSIFNQKELPFNVQDISFINESNYQGLIQLCALRQLPHCCKKEIKIELIDKLLATCWLDDQTPSESVKEELSLTINSQSKTIFVESFKTIFGKEINFKKLEKVILNGVSMRFKDFLEILMVDGLDPEQHLFSCDANQLLYPNPYVRHFYSDFKAFYEFLGQIFALNIIHGNHLKVELAPFFLDKLMNLDYFIFNINDLSTIDMEVSKNLLLLSKTDEELESFNFRFVITQNTFGKLHTHEIIPDGANIPVTKENKNEYIHSVVEFILDKQIKLQCKSFKAGINVIFPADLFNILSSKELNAYLRGT